ncbi:hypothetical protein ACNI65_08150 [Roseateles sp. So40a]|uniref:hypothetical protein n=1 Tax=Roseateles sp. So40a TaxID=3400226 RepID=UPI003A878492
MRLRRQHLAAVIASLASLYAPTVRASDRLATIVPPGIVSVRPSGPTVPENLLRISLRFAIAPTAPVLRRLALIGPDDRPVADPFLDQELWSPDGKVLTVLLHPGRLKTGLIAHDALGAALVDGEVIRLTLDGRELHRWRVQPRDETGPQTRDWQLPPLPVGRRESVDVRLDAPIDALEVDYLAVIDAQGRRVPGRAELLDGETVWRFSPARAWSAGPFRLIVRATLEDPAGNRLNDRFEAPAGALAKRALDAMLPLRTCAIRTNPCSASSGARLMPP